jgi:hypothetical protein
LAEFRCKPRIRRWCARYVTTNKETSDVILLIRVHTNSMECTRRIFCDTTCHF